jgi:hypothetical protein
MPVTIARKTARKRVNLKTRKKRGIKIAHRIIVRQPVARSFDSNIRVVLPVFPFQRGSITYYNRSGLMNEGVAVIALRMAISKSGPLAPPPFRNVNERILRVTIQLLVLLSLYGNCQGCLLHYYKESKKDEETWQLRPRIEVPHGNLVLHDNGKV